VPANVAVNPGPLPRTLTPCICRAIVEEVARHLHLTPSCTVLVSDAQHERQCSGDGNDGGVLTFALVWNWTEEIVRRVQKRLPSTIPSEVIKYNTWRTHRPTTDRRAQYTIKITYTFCASNYFRSYTPFRASFSARLSLTATYRR